MRSEEEELLLAEIRSLDYGFDTLFERSFFATAFYKRLQNEYHCHYETIDLSLTTSFCPFFVGSSSITIHISGFEMLYNSLLPNSST